MIKLSHIRYQLWQLLFLKEDLYIEIKIIYFKFVWIIVKQFRVVYKMSVL